MESGLIHISLKSSMFIFITLGIITQIAYCLMLILRPYFIRNVRNITLEYTQNIYFSAYVFLTNLSLYFSIAVYLAIFILRTANGNIFGNAFLFIDIGAGLLLIYALSRIFIDYSTNIVYSIISLSVNIIALILNIFSYILIIRLFFY